MMNRIPFQRFYPWLWLAPVLLALLAHLNVLQNGFGWDDEVITQGLRAPEHWWRLILPDFSEQQDASYYRPVVELSYMLDYAVWGVRPFGFHLSVLLAHLLNTALVFFLARRLTAVGQARGAAAPSGQTRRSAPTHPGELKVRPYNFLPLIAASLFAVHPAHSEAVAWIAGRNDVFCTAFMLSSLLLYIRFHRTGNGWAYAGSMAAFFLALLTKEAAVGFILLFPLYDYLTATGMKGRGALRWLMPFFILGLYFFLRNAAITRPFVNDSVTTVSWPSAVSEAIGAFGLYLKLLVFPYPHNPFIATLPASATVLILTVPAAGGLLTGLIFALVRRQVLYAMGLAWMLALLAPAVWVAVLHVAVTPAAERYAYGPSAGVSIVIAGLIKKGLDRFPADAVRPSGRVKVAVGLLIFLNVITWGWESWNRNGVWRDSMTFWQAASAASPEAAFPHRRLGLLNARLERTTEAESHYRQAIALYEKSPRPDLLPLGDSYNDLAVFYHTRGRYAEAEPFYQRSLAIREKALAPDHPDLAMGLHNLALFYYSQSRYAEAETLYQRAIAIYENPARPDLISIGNILNDLAVLYHTEGRYAEAEPLYRRSLAIREKALAPDHPELIASLQNYASLLRMMNRDEEADKLDARAQAAQRNVKK